MPASPSVFSPSIALIGLELAKVSLSHRREKTALSRVLQQHAATFFAQGEDPAGTELPQFVKHDFDVSAECGILAHGIPRPLQNGLTSLPAAVMNPR